MPVHSCFPLASGRLVSSFVVALAAVGFGASWVSNLLFLDGPMGFPSYIRGVEGLLLIVLSLAYFGKLLREKNVSDPTRDFGFWLSTALLIFFSGNLLRYFFSDVLMTHSERAWQVLLALHSVLTILLYLLYTLAIIWAVKTPKSS